MLGAVLTVSVMGSPLLVVTAQQGGQVQTPAPSGGPDDPYDCGDFDTREQVEAIFNPDNDVSGLDRDNDGVACEGIGSPSEDQTETSTPTNDQTATSTPSQEDTSAPTSEQTETPASSEDQTATPTPSEDQTETSAPTEDDTQTPTSNDSNTESQSN